MTRIWKNPIFQMYLKESRSKGLFGNKAYQVLYEWVRENKPKEVLECGTGKSTIAMAVAMKENGFGRVTSMEQSGLWFEHAKELLPLGVAGHVEIILSGVEGYCGGYRYRETPERLYEMVFVDGPELQPNFDYLWVLNFCNPEAPAIVDGRTRSVKFLSTILYKQNPSIMRVKKTSLRLIKVNQEENRWEESY